MASNLHLSGRDALRLRGRSHGECQTFPERLVRPRHHQCHGVPTVHKVSAEAPFDAASKRGMRLIAGKVLMNRHAPRPARRCGASGKRLSRVDCQMAWLRDRLAYAVTVRFAPTSTPEQLKMAGRLLGRPPRRLHANPLGRNARRSSVGVHAVPRGPQLPGRLCARRPAGRRAAFSPTAFGSTPKTARRCKQAGAQIAHCPTSNLFLGSGLFDWPRAEREGVAVSLATRCRRRHQFVASCAPWPRPTKYRPWAGTV
jgi:guanine deaminase